MCGVAEISAAITAAGTITRFSPFQRIRVGEYARADGRRLDVLSDCCAASGIGFDRPSDIHTAVWSKFVFLVGLSGITAVTRRPIGEVRSDPDTRAMLRSMMTEANSIGRERGVALPEETVDAQLAFMDTLPSNLRASMALDVEHGRRLELPWLSGAVSRMGRALGIPTPANDFVVAALKLLDSNSGVKYLSTALYKDAATNVREWERQRA
jgi:2-dehydropantoate 2-reductase